MNIKEENVLPGSYLVSTIAKITFCVNDLTKEEIEEHGPTYE